MNELASDGAATGRPLIAVVCSGNICRSPMAAALLEELFDRLGIEADVCSMGTLGIVDHPASRHAAQALAMIGIDLSRHRSCGLDPETLARADTVLVMAEEHARAVVEVAPDASPRIARLWRYADAPSASGEIADPVGRTIYDFLACRDVLIECLRSWVLERFGETEGHPRA